MQYRFEKWLVNEALERLVLGTSETLELLSGNKYALAVNEGNEFEVIDHRNADDRRAAKTLSGGETFPASLALALALADQVGAMASGGAAKLDSIFLDEGFGTLDADWLEHGVECARDARQRRSDGRHRDARPRARRPGAGALRGRERPAHVDNHTS